MAAVDDNNTWNVDSPRVQDNDIKDPGAEVDITFPSAIDDGKTGVQQQPQTAGPVKPSKEELKFKKLQALYRMVACGARPACHLRRRELLEDMEGKLKTISVQAFNLRSGGRIVYNPKFVNYEALSYLEEVHKGKENARPDHLKCGQALATVIGDIRTPTALALTCLPCTVDWYLVDKTATWPNHRRRLPCGLYVFTERITEKDIGQVQIKKQRMQDAMDKCLELSNRMICAEVTIPSTFII